MQNEWSLIAVQLIVQADKARAITKTQNVS